MKAKDVPIGAIYRHAAYSYEWKRCEPPPGKDPEQVWGEGHPIVFGAAPDTEVVLVGPWKRITRLDEVPVGARWRWIDPEDGKESHYIRDEPRPGDIPEQLYGVRVEPNAAGELGGRGHMFPDGSKPIEVLDIEPKQKQEQEPPVIDILTASKGQLVEEAVRKFGPEARENALRTRLEQLREALQENEAPAWWSIGAGPTGKVKPGQGKGKAGAGAGNGNGNSNIIVLGRDEQKHQSIDLKPEQLAEVLEPFFSKRDEASRLDEAKVAKMVDAAVKHHVPKPVEVKVELPNGEHRDVGKSHRDFPQLLKFLGLNLNVMLVGPAGSFKTSSAEKAAEALSLPFYMTSVGMQTSKADLLGYQDAHGNTVRTHLRNAYENGGLFLLDEVDAGNANVLTVINALLANNVAAFPDAMVRRHENFRFVAAGNTFGKGADRQYVGRNQLDAATLDRFVVLYWDYDEEYELEIAGPDQSEWTRYVQKIRRAVEKAKVRQIVSPRASIHGAKMLRAGMKRKDVEQAVLWASMTADDQTKVRANAA